MRVLFHFNAEGALAARLAALRDQRIEVVVVPEADVAGFDAALPSVDVLWHVLRPVTAADFARAPKLKLVQKFGVGVNTIDVEAAKRRDVAICNLPGTNSRAVAELTLLLMLGCLRQLPALGRIADDGRDWSLPGPLQARLGELGGRTVGFVGAGAVPSTLAPWLVAMGATLVVATRRDTPGPWTRLDLDALLERADVVSLHLPATPETNGILSAARIARMKPGAVLVNTARGSLVDEDALARALGDGRLAAAGLDVTSVEPLPADHPLRRLPNVLLTPHAAWLTPETFARSLDVAVENVLRLERGEALRNRVA